MNLRVLWMIGLVLSGACAPDAPATNPRADIRIAVITHGQSADPFWSVVANGVKDAAAELGVRADYQAPTRFDPVEMSQRIEGVIASKPSGLVVSIPDPGALSAAIRRAVAAGIPVISINSGADVAAALIRHKLPAQLILAAGDATAIAAESEMKSPVFKDVAGTVQKVESDSHTFARLGDEDALLAAVLEAVRRLDEARAVHQPRSPPA